MHPFELPDQNQALNVELLPPLTSPPAPTVVVRLQPRQADLAPPQTPPKPVEAQLQPPRSPPVEVRPSQPAVEKPVEVERRAVQAPRLQSQLAAPQIPEAPPEPLQVTRSAPALQPQVEVSRAQALSQPRQLETSRTPPPLPQAAAPSQVQVLTNQAVIQAPVEIRPRERAPPAISAASQPGAAEIPAPAAGPQAGGGPAAGQAEGQAGGQGRAGRPGVEDFKGLPGINGGFGAKGLRQTLGCEDPDTYKLTSEERAACLERFAQRAKAAPDLGPRISAKNQAAYDHYEACQKAYKRPGIPGANEPSEGTSITGLGSNPSLRACGPGER